MTKKQKTITARKGRTMIEEKPLATNETAADLLHRVGVFAPSGRKKILEAIKANVASVELAGTAEGEKACVDKIAEPFMAQREVDLFRVAIRDCIRELCNYRHEIREQVLTAALLRATETVIEADRLKAMMPRIQKAMLGLTLKQKATSHLLTTLCQTGDDINVDFVTAALRPAQAQGKAKMEVLGTDPNLRDLIEAYELAIQIHESY